LRRHSLAVLALLVALGGCGTATQYPNQPLAAGASNPAGQAVDIPPTRPAIVMSFSGGGSRAAALALFVLQELRRHPDGEPGRTLLDDVVVVSSVSGGSVTAAQFGLYGAAGLDRMVPDFLALDNMAALEWQAASPVTWFRLLSGRYTRVQVVRDLFDRQLFHGATFAQMVRPGAPMVILNATDMGSGEVFAFTSERFNDICSDLSALPVSVGVAASSAVPIVLSPVDLRNDAVGCAGNLPPAQWISDMLTKRYPRYLDVEELKRARYANSLRHGPDAYRPIDYLHLLDGGLADNVGAHSLLDVLTSPHGSLRMLNAINTGKLRRVAVIEVNARSDPSNSLSAQPETPGVLSMVNSVISNPIDAATSGNATELRTLLNELRDGASNAPPDALLGGTRVYDIEVDFDQFLPDQTALRDQVKNVPTSWTISSADIQALDQAAQLLLHQHPCFQALLFDVHDPTGNASDACPQPAPLMLRPPQPTTARTAARTTTR
jgi:NTE family protein